MIRVFIADDHAIVREGVKRVLGSVTGVVVVGEAEDGEEVLRRIEVDDFDVLVLDLSLPGRSGLDVLRAVKAARPRTKVIVLTMHAEDQYAARILRAGADGYLTKGRSPLELVDAIHAVVAGGKYVSPTMAALLLDGGPTEKPPHTSLTDREFGVLVALGRGKTPSQIAGELDLSPSTVSTHIGRIKQKLGTQSLGEIVQYALRAGLVE